MPKRLVTFVYGAGSTARVTLSALVVYVFSVGPLSAGLSDFEVCFNQSASLYCQGLVPKPSSEESLKPPVVWTPDLPQALVAGKTSWMLVFLNQGYPAPGSPHTMDISLRWCGGSVSRSVKYWYPSAKLSFDMAVPVQEGFYVPTPVELAVSLRDADGAVYDSIEGIYFNLQSPIPEEETLVTGIIRGVAAVLKLLRLAFPPELV